MPKTRKRENASTSVTSPRVARVTPEGRLVYDPASVVHSEPAQKHLKELEKKNPAAVPGGQ